MIEYIIMAEDKLFLTKTNSDVKWVKRLSQAKLYKTETNARKVMEELQAKFPEMKLSIAKVAIDD